MDRVEEIRLALEGFARAMVCHKKALRVTVERRGGPEVFFRIEAAQADLRYLIGSMGSNFDALSRLIWSMGNVEPRIQTRLLRFADKPMTYQPDATGAVDPSEVLRELLLDIGLPNLASVRGPQVRMLLERAGDGAEELRAYLLCMRDDLCTEARTALRARK